MAKHPRASGIVYVVATEHRRKAVRRAANPAVCPSGQREQTVNLPAQPSQVRILAPPHEGRPPPNCGNVDRRGSLRYRTRSFDLNRKSAICHTVSRPDPIPDLACVPQASPQASPGGRGRAVTPARSTPAGQRRSGGCPLLGLREYLRVHPEQHRDRVACSPGALHRVHAGTRPEGDPGATRVVGPPREQGGGFGLGEYPFTSRCPPRVPRTRFLAAAPRDWFETTVRQAPCPGWRCAAGAAGAAGRSEGGMGTGRESFSARALRCRAWCASRHLLRRLRDGPLHRGEQVDSGRHACASRCGPQPLCHRASTPGRQAGVGRLRGLRGQRQVPSSWPSSGVCVQRPPVVPRSRRRRWVSGKPARFRAAPKAFRTSWRAASFASTLRRTRGPDSQEPTHLSR